MSSLNKVMIIGNLGADPESRTFENGGMVTNISVATSSSWTDKNTGEKQEATEWHRVALFNKLAEISAKYLKKGAKVYIEGALHTRKWTDQNGQDRYTTEIRANTMKMLDSAGTGTSNASATQTQAGGAQQANTAPAKDTKTLTDALAEAQAPQPQSPVYDEIDESDIPFG